MHSSLFRVAVLALLLAPAAVSAQTTTAPAGSNPPGTAAGRALDRAAGTDTSGAYPSQADGTRENPAGTAASRTAHRTNRSAHRAARHSQTLRNNSATRTLDRAAGTDNSGAYPSQTDGMPGNPRGTAVSRTLGTTNTR